MRLQGSALRLTIFVGEHDTWLNKPLYHEIVHRAHQQGLAGASVMRDIEGYGASSRIHTTRILSLSEDLPLAIIIVDAADKIRAVQGRPMDCTMPRPAPPPGGACRGVLTVVSSKPSKDSNWRRHRFP